MTEMFMHCAQCLPRRPRHVSPEHWARLSAFIDGEGIAIRCVRCDRPIIHLTPDQLTELLASPPDCGDCGRPHRGHS